MAEQAIPDLPDEGKLDEIGSPHLLAAAWRDKRTGLLELSHGASMRTIEVREGNPVGVESRPHEDTFASFLEETSRIRAADRAAIEKLAADRKCPQASAVLALALLDAPAIYQAMRQETRVGIAETFDWRGGMYRWSSIHTPPNPRSKPFDVLALLQRELPRRWGTDRLFQAAMVSQDICGDITPRARKVARKLAESGAAASQAISLLDGHRPLGRVLGECAGEPLAAATLWTVLYSGLLRIGGSSPAARSTSDLEFDLEIEVSGGDQAGAAATRGKSEGRRSSAQDDKGATLRNEIESLLGQLSALDHYSALGLEEGASAGEVKKAYFKAAKKYHPDALARLGLDDLKAPAAQVFARIAEAFETLSDPAKRAAYDAGGSAEPEIDTARLAQAETSFRKGEVLAKMGNFDGALEYLEPAVELWPEEPAYQAGLGWALYKQPKTDLPRAIEHLEKALSMAQTDAVILFRLGLVHRASGDTPLANDLIQRARSIQPDVHE